MTYSEMLDAVREARETIENGDIAARQVARLLVDRLRIAKVDADYLKVLKRELQNFNAVTGRWK